MAAPGLLQPQQTSLTQHPKMFRGVVLRNPDTICNLGDVERRVDQQADDADARVLGERLQRDDAIVIAGRRCGGSFRVREAIELERLGCGPGLVHRTAIKIAQSGERGKPSSAHRNLTDRSPVPEDSASFLSDPVAAEGKCRIAGNGPKPGSD